jgi:hypothetical protein
MHIGTLRLKQLSSFKTKNVEIIDEERRTKTITILWLVSGKVKNQGNTEKTQNRKTENRVVSIWLVCWWTVVIYASYSPQNKNHLLLRKKNLCKPLYINTLYHIFQIIYKWWGIKEIHIKKQIGFSGNNIM